MVWYTLKILQHLLEDFEIVSNQFVTLSASKYLMVFQGNLKVGRMEMLY